MSTEKTTDLTKAIDVLMALVSDTENKTVAGLNIMAKEILSLYNGAKYHKLKLSRDKVLKQINNLEAQERALNKKLINSKKSIFNYDDISNGNLLPYSYTLYYRNIECGDIHSFLKIKMINKEAVQKESLSNRYWMLFDDSLTKISMTNRRYEDNVPFFIPHEEGVPSGVPFKKQRFIEVHYAKKTKLLNLDDIKDKLKVVLKD